MKKLLILAGLLFVFSTVDAARAQSRKAVGAAEVNGTFRQNFSGKFKGSHNEIKILALGGGKLRVSFDLLYPYLLSTGEKSANMGSAEGEATIEGDTAVYASEENGQCRITIKFVKAGTIEVTQNGTDAECGFGFNVSAGGTYKKSSGAKPKFEQK